MPDELRLDYRTSGPVFSKREELVLWAKDDGTIHTTDQDGTDVEIGAGGGGGSSTLQVLGPYTVDWDDPAVNSASKELVALDQGVIVVRAWAFVTEEWVTSEGDGFQFSVGIGAASDEYPLADYPTSPGDVGPVEGFASALVGSEWGSRTGIVTGAGWKLWADVWVNGAGDVQSGSLDVYALVHTPA